jgi:hypothetical protein
MQLLFLLRTILFGYYLVYFICSLFNNTVSNFSVEWLDSKQLIGKDIKEVVRLNWSIRLETELRIVRTPTKIWTQYL